jgi:hypothetical protein
MLSTHLHIVLTLHNLIFLHDFFAGVGLVIRKMGNAVCPVIELTKNGDEYTLTSQSTFKNTSITFKLGEEFQEETPDGRLVKTTITQDNNKLVQVQKGEKETTIIREFNEDQVKMVSSSLHFE